ncbi:hypothetical protein AJ80_07786 [Polytolypa hystricis UAMH7299]|uniref:Lysophospholipase n=1 Tax=Polytolypa hystricis (strain UAMH7299) TaxID=1447883 RepID=A0A2B7XJE8_POLH7|nr:hypothetical protein AJ80_07786 [Polytolypa hystricis UAMH7299]
MKYQWSALGVAAGFLSASHAATVPAANVEVLRRALPNAPDGYTPEGVRCPSTRPTVRGAAKLSDNELDWLKGRREKTLQGMKDFFGHVSIDGFDASSYIDQHASNDSSLPNIGIAVSGGGYRALMNGAGAVKAFDSRTDGSTSSGHLGGLLQSATYLAGLSGGGWLVGSLYLNNDSSVQELQDETEGSVWEFSSPIFLGPKANDSSQVSASIDYYGDLVRSVDGKRDAGYDVSITDYWGRALSYQLINAPEGGVNYTWSSIALSDGFKNADMPMPILIADGRNPGELLILGNATVFEFNPFEFGTFDPTIFGFVPVEYLGSKFEEGVIPNNESCVRGFDNAGFIMGTSSSLFNQILLQIDDYDVPSLIKTALKSVLKSIGADNNDIAPYEPNPFYKYAEDTSPFADLKSLSVVDGGEDLQNIPLHPLIQPERHVDVIIAVDSSADNIYNWPNGTALVATYNRSLNSTGIANGTAFPAIPDVNTFVNLGLNSRPTFFGCDSSNMTGPSPLIVYIPNSPYVTFSNTSTFDMAYNNTLRDAIIQNGYNVATMGNGTRDENWSTCVGCAVLSRSFERTNTAVPEACKKCFDTYCWDGKLDSKTPDTYAPSILLDALKIDAEDNAASALFTPVGVSFLSAIAVAMFSLV